MTRTSPSRISAIWSATDSNVTEQKMFGGLAFLISGNMAVAASGQGGLLVHVDAARGDKLIASGVAQPMEMRGRAMNGWIRVPSDTAGEPSNSWLVRVTLGAEHTGHRFPCKI